MHTFDKVFCPARRGDDSVSHRLSQFVFGGTDLLRDREVFGESVRAVHRYRAGHPDQFSGFDVENFGEFVIKNLVAGLHRGRLLSIEYLYL